MVLIRVPLRRILQVPIVGGVVCAVVVAATTMRGAAVRRTVTAGFRIALTTTSGFAWLSPSNDIFTKKTKLKRQIEMAVEMGKRRGEG